jgi:tRNA/rRNA methyltransferase
VIALSNRTSKGRGHFELLNDFVPEIHQQAMKTKVAILFGRESCGLLNEEIFYANRCIRIHTAGHFSSLNLSQAVLVTCYELLCSEGVTPDDRPSPASNDNLEQCYKHITEVLWKIGYGARGERLHPDNLLKVIRQLAGRALPDEREIKMLRGICSQVEKLTDRPGSSQKEK